MSEGKKPEDGGGGGGGGVDGDGGGDTPHRNSVAGTAVLMKSVSKFIRGSRRGRTRHQFTPVEGNSDGTAQPRPSHHACRRGGGEDARTRRMEYPADNLRGRQRGGARPGAIGGKTSPNLVEYFRKRTHFNKEELDALCHVFLKLVETTQSNPSKGKARNGNASGAGVGAEGSSTAPASSGAAASGGSATMVSGGVTSLGGGIWMPTDGLDRVVFREVLHNTFDLVTEEVLMDRVFCAFDRRNDGVLRLDEWLLGLSVFVRGDANERMSFCFRVYDLNGDGVISRDEMFQLLRNCLMKQPNDEDPDEGVRDLVELTLKKMDRDKDGKVSFTDFQEAVTAEPLLLEAFGQCLPSEVACQTFMSTLLA